MTAVNNVIGLDIGEKRIGVARVNMIAKIPEPLATLSNDNSFSDALQNMINDYQPDILVVGWPRNLNGQTTRQTEYIKDFTNKYLTHYKLPIIYQDETLSSREAEARLDDKRVSKAGIDALAAVVILEDYLKEL